MAKIVQQDPGPSVSQLARVSHIHLFGISIIFLLTGAIFNLNRTPIWLRVVLVVLPYVTIVMDIGSWWATEYVSPIFAYIVIGSGALMGLALASQILISLWEMWIDPLKRGFRVVRTGPSLRRNCSRPTSISGSERLSTPSQVIRPAGGCDVRIHRWYAARRVGD